MQTKVPGHGRWTYRLVMKSSDINERKNTLHFTLNSGWLFGYLNIVESLGRVAFCKKESALEVIRSHIGLGYMLMIKHHRFIGGGQNSQWQVVSWVDFSVTYRPEWKGPFSALFDLWTVNGILRPECPTQRNFQKTKMSHHDHTAKRASTCF